MSESNSRPSPLEWTVLCAVLALSGCGGESRPTKPIDGGVTRYIQRYCYEGVTYLFSDRGITVMMDKDSKVVPCTTRP